MQTRSVIITVVFFAVLGGFVGYAVSQKNPKERREPTALKASISLNEFNLRETMRKLLSEHAVATHTYVSAVIDNHPSFSTSANRLVKNVEDIGGVFEPFYGKDFSEQLIALLREHAIIEDLFVQTFKANNKPNLRETLNRWEKNKKALIDLLLNANSNLSRNELTDVLEAVIVSLKDSSRARLDKQWQKELQSFDRAYEHIIRLSDIISKGVVKQFPDRF